MINDVLSLENVSLSSDSLIISALLYSLCEHYYIN